MAIEVLTQAEMKCDAADCKAAYPIRLCLMSHGGFGFRPLKGDHGWQITVLRNGVFAAHCPKHIVKETLVQPVSAIPDLAKAKRSH